MNMKTARAVRADTSSERRQPASQESSKRPDPKVNASWAKPTGRTAFSDITPAVKQAN